MLALINLNYKKNKQLIRININDNHAIFQNIIINKNGTTVISDICIY